MANYYNADTLLEFVRNNTPTIAGQTTLQCVERAINEAPTADVVEVKHGKWKVKRDDYDTQIIKCSVCKEEFYPPDNDFDFDFLPNYCMNCGAKMEGRKSNDR